MGDFFIPRSDMATYINDKNHSRPFVHPYRLCSDATCSCINIHTASYNPSYGYFHSHNSNYIHAYANK